MMFINFSKILLILFNFNYFIKNYYFIYFTLNLLIKFFICFFSFSFLHFFNFIKFFFLLILLSLIIIFLIFHLLFNYKKIFLQKNQF
jgi:hypothetical protein